jgi:hypothetical protein
MCAPTGILSHRSALTKAPMIAPHNDSETVTLATHTRGLLLACGLLSHKEAAVRSPRPAPTAAPQMAPRFAPWPAERPRLTSTLRNSPVAIASGAPVGSVNTTTESVLAWLTTPTTSLLDIEVIRTWDGLYRMRTPPQIRQLT